MIRLAESLTWNNKVQPIKLAATNTIVPTGTRCLVTGWGDTQSAISAAALRGVEVPIVDYSSCKESYDNLSDPDWNQELGPENMCAGYDRGHKDCEFLV